MIHTTPGRHELKTWPVYFQALIDGIKTAEIRRDDRGFRPGDILWLREWSPGYTGREASASVTHITRDIEGLADGFVMLSLGRVVVWTVDGGDGR